MGKHSYSQIVEIGETIIKIDPKSCICWEYADRQEFEMGDLNKLANDILMNGQLQPIIVREVGENYEIIAGQRRWRACKIAGINVKAIVRNLN
jgi:ParB family chromosome partitioning protein